MEAIRPFAFRLPREIYFGWGKGAEAGELVKSLGKKAFIVTGRRATKETGILGVVTSSLEKAGLEWVVFDQVEPEPSLETVDAGLRKAYQENCDLVLSLGGGSALDCGKAIAGLLGQDESVVPYFNGIKNLEGPGAPWVALPTTAGTGSEMTNNAVLTNYRLGIKKSFRSPYLVARMAIIDPQFTVFLNARLTASSGIDALVQAIEAFTSPRTNPVSELLALEAIRLLWQFLPRAVAKGDERHFREQVAKGSMISAMAFANASSGPAHGLSHIIGPAFGIPHGEACGLLFPVTMRFNREVLGTKYVAIAKAVGIEGASQEEIIGAFEKAFRGLLEKIGLRTRLRDFGVTKEALRKVVKEELIQRSLRENPRPIDVDEAVELLCEAW
ncbi:MAG: iron-containing alcohol dehydrogenase [Candidatus Atribacteria bacterium]|nr:iron-containing alcohol dehydrogenase [Candidatus Atribacteria bacterium]MCD6349407.1 iron-containing alcohol dehydrogenase [Candidatus Atribacteria bacterium]